MSLCILQEERSCNVSLLHLLFICFPSDQLCDLDLFSQTYTNRVMIVGKMGTYIAYCNDCVLDPVM